MINLTHMSPDVPLMVTEEEYVRLIGRKNRGWSNCIDDREWMAKLYYLRDGFKQGKISKQDFFEKEKDLVMRWWMRWVQ